VVGGPVTDPVDPVKPPRLRAGDTVAVVSTSWGGPSVFPHVFDRGVDVLRRAFGLEVRELPSARMAPADLGASPRLRADDLNAAFADPEVRAIVSSIGGVDSVRILEHLNPALAVSDPKILVADEPTGDLDAKSGDEILELLRRLNEEFGKTVVMVTHDPKAAARAHRMVHLDKGVLHTDERTEIGAGRKA